MEIENSQTSHDRTGRDTKKQTVSSCRQNQQQEQQQEPTTSSTKTNVLDDHPTETMERVETGTDAYATAHIGSPASCSLTTTIFGRVCLKASTRIIAWRTGTIRSVASKASSSTWSFHPCALLWPSSSIPLQRSSPTTGCVYTDRVCFGINWRSQGSEDSSLRVKSRRWGLQEGSSRCSTHTEWYLSNTDTISDSIGCVTSDAVPKTFIHGAMTNMTTEPFPVLGLKPRCTRIFWGEQGRHWLSCNLVMDDFSSSPSPNNS